MFDALLTEEGRLNPCLYKRFTQAQSTVRWAIFFAAARMMSGLPQYQFAREIGVSQGYLSRIEAGERTPTPQAKNGLLSFINKELGVFSDEAGDF